MSRFESFQQSTRRSLNARWQKICGDAEQALHLTVRQRGFHLS
jgi:hypothetical protein